MVIEIASQIVHQYDPTKKTVENQKTNWKTYHHLLRFNSTTKKLEGRALKAGGFVSKDEKGNVIETVTNDAAGKITFSNLEFKRGEEGTHLYHVKKEIRWHWLIALNTIRWLPLWVLWLTKTVKYWRLLLSCQKIQSLTTLLYRQQQSPTTRQIHHQQHQWIHRQQHRRQIPPTPPTPPPPTPPTPTTPPAPALPETGEEQSASAALLGAALGMVSLAGLAKTQKRED